MSGFFSFIGGLNEFVLFIGVVIAVIAFLGYNRLRALAESCREAVSNIDIVCKKQISLTNQLLEVVKGYQESEKLVMLKISDDMSSAGKAAQLYQQSNMVLSATTGIAQKIPELKSNENYKLLIGSIQVCEAQLEKRMTADRRRRPAGSEATSISVHLQAPDEQLSVFPAPDIRQQ
jgi:hypothetical protein